jgi:hypothetical protein
MVLIILAVLVGLVGGLALGGRFHRLGEIQFRWWGLAFLGLVLQLAPIPSRPGRADHVAAVSLLVASYLVLLLFVVVNIRVAGFPLIAAGFALNALVISLNGGMPVSDHALRVAAGPYYLRTRARLETEGGEKHHAERPSDVLVPLADVIPVGAPIRQVLSAGDVLWLVGTSWVIARGMAPRKDRVPEEPGGVPLERAAGPAAEPVAGPVAGPVAEPAAGPVLGPAAGPTASEARGP